MVNRDDILEDPAIRIYLHRLVGEEGLELLRRFPGDGEYSDEDLAAKTGINLNTVRHTLYTLHERRLAEYRRIKNAETGWLTYLWKLNLDAIYDAVREDMRTILERLEVRERFEEENDFFMCADCGRFTFMEVADLGFICPRCGQEVTHFENEILLRALKKRTAAIRECLRQ